MSEQGGAERGLEVIVGSAKVIVSLSCVCGFQAGAPLPV